MANGMFSEKDVRRFEAKVMPEPNSGCWLWAASTKPNGYGQIGKGKQAFYAHRVSWEIHNGPIPTGMHVLHRCDVPCCVNPDHLRVGTNAENSADMVKKKRQAAGKKNGRAKLTDGQVRAIRALEGKMSHGEIAKLFSVSKGLVSLIVLRKIWRHI